MTHPPPFLVAPTQRITARIHPHVLKDRQKGYVNGYRVVFTSHYKSGKQWSQIWKDEDGDAILFVSRQRVEEEVSRVLSEFNDAKNDFTIFKKKNPTITRSSLDAV